MTSYSLIQQLVGSVPVLTDGAWGMLLQARGLASGDTSDLWNLSHPLKVAEVARAYVEAGSRIILTNTFGGNRFRLAEARTADHVVEINEAGARLSREAAGKNVFVFASIGPSGKMLVNGDTAEWDDLARNVEHMALNEDEAFQGIYAKEMRFPK